MHWLWEDADKKERGYCAAAVSRAQSMMWGRELRERDQQILNAGASTSPKTASTGQKLPWCWSCRRDDLPGRGVDRAHLAKLNGSMQVRFFVFVGYRVGCRAFRLLMLTIHGFKSLLAEEPSFVAALAKPDLWLSCE
jgi:hypothetical protein